MKTTLPSHYLAVSTAILCAALLSTPLSQTVNAFTSDQQTSDSSVDLPSGVSDVVKLAKAGMGEDVIIAQIKSAGTTYKLSPDQIIYLSNAGVSQNVIKALITPASGAAPSEAPAAPAPVQPQPSAPQPVADESVNAPAPNQGVAMAAEQPASQAYSIPVPARIRWYNTNIDVTQGQTLSFTAGGYVRVAVGPYRQFVATPGGIPSIATFPPHPFAAPGLTADALVGRIGDGMPFEIGNGTTVQAGSSGRLFLSVNAASFSMNQGAWQVGLNVSGGAPVVVVAAEPPAQVSMDYFQQQLAPYGQWVETANGTVWVPADAGTPGWRPYSNDGSWVYTDEGLFWQSDRPWGDVVFHYGRWSIDPVYGWVWTPGFDWAPAWVAWRHGEAEGFIGWAPLPPAAVFEPGIGLVWSGHHGAVDVEFGLGEDAYVFIGADHFWEHDYHRFYFERERIHYFYGHSMIHNGYRFEGGRFHVEGLGREHLGAFTHHEIRAERARDIRAHEERAHFEARHEAVRAHVAAHPEMKPHEAPRNAGPAHVEDRRAANEAHPSIAPKPAAAPKSQPAAKPATKPAPQKQPAKAQSKNTKDKDKEKQN